MEGRTMTKKGIVVCELPPSEGNPRNSEGAFLDLKDGRILFIYSKFIGSSSKDDGTACLSAVYSSDGGNTWSDESVVITADSGELNLMSVSLIRMQNGDIGLFYIIRKGWHDTRLHIRRSADEGQSWSDPVCCIPWTGYFVTSNDRVLRLKNGRILIPAAYHRMRGESTTDWKSFNGRSSGAFFFYSDDDGETWLESKNYCDIISVRTNSGLQEPGVIELDNGVLWGWARTDLGRQYEMYSMDNGYSWTAAEPSIFTSPCSPLSMKRIPLNRNLLAVWNPNPINNTLEWPVKEKRTPLVCSVSSDDGNTWGKYHLLEDDELSGYCYTAIHFTRDSVLLAYCAGGTGDQSFLSRLRIRKIMLKEIED